MIVANPANHQMFDCRRTYDKRSGKHVTHQDVVCSKCGATDEAPMTSRTPLPPDVLAKKFRRAGWVIGRNRNHDVCPRCAKTAAKDTSMAKTEVPKAAQPRTPTREEKRVIILELEDSYIGEDKGYVAGKSDKTVAEALDVPVGWVRDMREEFFGSLGANEEVFAEMAELAKRYTETGGKIEIIQKGLKSVKAEHDELAKALQRIRDEFGVKDK